MKARSSSRHHEGDILRDFIDDLPVVLALKTDTTSSQANLFELSVFDDDTSEYAAGDPSSDERSAVNELWVLSRRFAKLSKKHWNSIFGSRKNKEATIEEVNESNARLDFLYDTWDAVWGLLLYSHEYYTTRAELSLPASTIDTLVVHCKRVVEKLTKMRVVFAYNKGEDKELGMILAQWNLIEHLFSEGGHVVSKNLSNGLGNVETARHKTLRLMFNLGKASLQSESFERGLENHLNQSNIEEANLTRYATNLIACVWNLCDLFCQFPIFPENGFVIEGLCELTTLLQKTMNPQTFYKNWDFNSALRLAADIGPSAIERIRRDSRLYENSIGSSRAPSPFENREQSFGSKPEATRQQAATHHSKARVPAIFPDSSGLPQRATLKHMGHALHTPPRSSPDGSPVVNTSTHPQTPPRMPKIFGIDPQFTTVSSTTEELSKQALLDSPADIPLPAHTERTPMHKQNNAFSTRVSALDQAVTIGLDGTLLTICSAEELTALHYLRLRFLVIYGLHRCGMRLASFPLPRQTVTKFAQILPANALATPTLTKAFRDAALNAEGFVAKGEHVIDRVKCVDLARSCEWAMMQTQSEEESEWISHLFYECVGYDLEEREMYKERVLKVL